MRASNRILRNRQLAQKRRSWLPRYLFTGSTTGVWYDPSDMTTLFQDAAGTTPVTAVERPVGLMLDKRDTAYSTYFDGSGDYLSTPDSTALNLSSGDFTIECWIYPQRSGIEVLNKGGVVGTYYPDYGVSYNGTGKIDFGIGGNLAAWQSYSGISLVPQNAWTHIAIVRSGNSIKSYINGVIDVNATYTKTAVNSSRDLNVGLQLTSPSAQNWLGNISNLRIVKGTALYTANFTPPTSPLTAVPGTSLLTCGTTWSGNPAITNNGNTRADKLNPFKTGTGNHAFNSSGNSANFPVLSARYNLLTKTEQFDDAVWGTFNGATKTGTDIAVAPDGTPTADSIRVTGTDSQVFQNVTLSAASYTLGFYVKRNSDTDQTFRLKSTTNTGVAAYSANMTATADWQWFSLTVTSAAHSGNISISSVAAGTQADLLVWGADLRVANDALNQPAYQRVNTATDYDTVGFKPYLKFNGTNQWLQTNSINFTYTDKMFVSAGVRKLSDAARGMLVELSDGAVGSIGFNLAAPNVAAPNYAISAKAGLLTDTVTTYAAPITNVIAAKYDMAGVSVNDCLDVRINGSVPTEVNTGTVGPGNYGNYPLYIGARAGSQLWFNGRLYGLIVAGKLANAVEITETEKYVNGKTAAY